MYIIIKHGVYIQGVVGITDTKKMAIKFTKKAVLEEPDDYHNFAIYKIKLNTYMPVGDCLGRAYWDSESKVKLVYVESKK